MRVPEYIIRLVKSIERLSTDLGQKEKELYAWLDRQNLDYDFENKYEDDNLDVYLHELFTFGNGDGLINKIRKIERK